MRQLISYAVGVWVGRYKLGTKGLHIAHPNPTDKELQEYWYGGVQVYIDDDGIIPILPQSSPFDDNLVSRIADFVCITFGEERLTENLNYIEQQLGQSIEQYLLKDIRKKPSWADIRQSHVTETWQIRCSKQVLLTPGGMATRRYVTALKLLEYRCPKSRISVVAYR